jgi:hypothetical protein
MPNGSLKYLMCENIPTKIRKRRAILKATLFGRRRCYHKFFEARIVKRAPYHP